jgi:hypothetical protein
VECVDLCGVGGVDDLSDTLTVPIRQKKGTSLAKHAFLAVKRCAMSIFIFISRYTRNFSIHFVKEVRRSIRNTPDSQSKNKFLQMLFTMLSMDGGVYKDQMEWMVEDERSPADGSNSFANFVIF